MRGIRPALSMMTVVLALSFGGLSGCTGAEDTLGFGPGKASPTPGLTGGVGANPTPTPTPSSSPSPTPTPSASPTPAALAVSISPATVKISVPAGIGAGPEANYPTSAQLSALVTMTGGGTASTVTWVSLSPEIATVDQSGLVTAIAPGSGAGPWTVQIQATSADLKATAIRNVTVTSEGDVTIEVQ